MAEIIEHMRIYTRKPEERLQTDVDLNASIVGALSLMEQQLRHHGIEICRELATDLPTVVGHPTNMEQVFVNLITNARDAICDRMVRDGRREGRIVVRSYRGSADQLHLEVDDDGGGVPERFRDRIFDSFFTTKEVGRGTGLGLAICQRIVREFGGSIRLVEGTAQHALFRITLSTGGGSSPAPAS
jgi:histidine kinase